MNFSCWSCREVFSSKRKWISHCNIHKHIGAWVCEHCDKQFGSEQARENHTKNKHEFWCNSCSKLHSTQDALDLHNKIHHYFPCGFGCDKNFTSMEARDQHNNNFHNHFCRSCNQRFGSKQLFIDHEAAYHIFKCEPCKRKFKNEDALEQHINSQAHPYRCLKCHKSFPSNSHLQEHIAAGHTSKCNQCHLVFDGPNHLGLHKKYEHGVIRCPICPAKFGRAVELNTHKVQQHSFQCEYCAVSPFETHILLKQHESTSHVLQCTVCPRQFRTQHSLNRHFEEAHNHVCSECGAKFNTLELLKSHRFSHQASCLCCQKKFDNVAAYELHYQNEHRLQCPKCPKAFKNVGEILQHAPEHVESVHPVDAAALKQFGQNTCNQCGGMFLKRLDLEKHLVNDHGIQLKCLRQSCSHISTSPDGFRIHHLSCSMVKCEKCEGFFDKEKDPALKTHVAEFHSPKPTFGCFQCTETFESSDAVAKHYSAEHVFVCQSCPGNFFINSDTRDRHLAICSNSSETSYSAESFQTTRIEFSPLMQKRPLPAIPDQPLIEIYDEPKIDRLLAANELAKTILAEAKARKGPTYTCQKCNAPPFTIKEEFETHMKISPFHGPPQLTCFECNEAFQTQLELLAHMQNAKHKVEWEVSIIQRTGGFEFGSLGGLSLFM